MKFVIITHVTHIKEQNQFYGYAPYIREMNIWLKYTDEVIIVGPVIKGAPTAIDIAYVHDKIYFREVPNFSFTSFKNNIKSLFKLPLLFWRIFRAMKSADHIHLRCPGNMGLLGSIVQIFFPKKKKTAKYAGNWDPQSKQPWTYRLQKYIISNSFLTRNMQVLVYGEWPDQSKNIKPFFTATYSDSEKEVIQKTGPEKTIEFIFVGSLVSGKNPMYVIKLVQKLVEKGLNANLNLYGDGIEKAALESYIKENKLQDYIFLRGNHNQETVKKAYQRSHFVVLPSKSEGWPKAIAEGMFWGCVPVATNVSCVPYMLDFGNRGILSQLNTDSDCAHIQDLIKNYDQFLCKSDLAREWSQHYTTDIFEIEIKKLLK